MKRFLSLFLSFSLLLSLCACSFQGSYKKYTKTIIDLFDTVSTITAYDTSEKEFENHISKLRTELEKYAELYDIYNDYDGVINIKYLNEYAYVSPVKVDRKIIELLLFGKEVYNLSNGLVNICMGSVLSVWHNARENALKNPDNACLPDTRLLNEKAQHTDINSLVIDESNNTVFFSDDELRLDVGAIAKGFTAEKISEYILQNELWQSAIISLGGNVKTIGFKDNDAKTPFRIGIENPENSDDYIDVVEVDDGKSVVTSGDYQRYFTVDNIKYCHIINPETLMPSDYVSSVTVIAENSAYADAFSTALFNMPIEQGLAFVNSLENTDAIWVDKNKNVIKSSNIL